MYNVLLLTLGCAQPSLEAKETTCGVEPPPAGSVRAKRIECEEEITESGEASIGDWLLENSLIKIAIRNIPNRMTQLKGAGGTIIDAAPSNGKDSITEIVPHVAGEWPETLSIHAESGAIVLTDDRNQQYRYTLEADSSRLHLDGATAFTVVTAPGGKRRGNWVQTGDLYLTSEANVIDEGGWLHWNNTDTLFMGPLNQVVQNRFQDLVTTNGETNGSLIEVELNGTTIFRLPVTDEQFVGLVPNGAQIRAIRSGHEASQWVLAGTDHALNVGESGFLNIEVQDENGTPIPSRLTWNGVTYSLSDTPTLVPVGPGIGTGRVEAGPEFGSVSIEELNVQDEVDLSISLERTASEAAWVDFSTRGFPDRTERRSTTYLKRKLSAQGVDLAILNAVDEVSQVGGSSDVDHLISVSSSSRSGGPYGGILAWAWSADNEKPAHGATDWDGIGPMELLSLMSRVGRRYTAVDATWLQAVGPAYNWSLTPDVVQVTGPQDIQALADLWDESVPTSVVGDKTWVHVTGRSKTEILRGIFEGRTSASTGPQLHLMIDDMAPGDSFDHVKERTVNIKIENPGDIETVHLMGPGGNIIQSWSISELPANTVIAHSGWVCAMATGSEDWVVTGPVWLNRP